MTCLAVFTLSFTTQSKLSLPEFSGTLALSLFLDIVAKADPSLARSLHESRRRKPYAVTPFEWKGRFYGFTEVPPGERVRIRASIVGDLARKFMEGLVDTPPFVVRLGDATLELDSVEARVHMMEEVSGVVAEAVRVDFLTPVRFSVAGTVKRKRPKFRLFPTPEHLFHSLADHWNEFAPARLRVPARLAEWVVNHAVEVDYRLRPVTLRGTKGRVFRGSVGYVIYRFDDASFLPWAAKLLEYGTMVNVGTGRSTGLGVMSYRPA